ncbi:MAG: ATP-binding cassette domain-containing protein [Tissierellia bacterium]|nr:ATP-binding cassette domain-containing protein [Tissierellia bacterium]
MSINVDIKKKIGDFDLNIKFKSDKKMIAILGASGSGKSMTLKCISGLLSPDEGFISIGDKILFDSRDSLNIPVGKRKIGYMFQSYALFPHMTALENIVFAMTGDSRENKRIAESLLKSFYIPELADRYPSQLSGGQKQRVAMARILATKPDLILLDEPFSALDGMLRWNMEEEIIGMIREYDIPTILVSHDRDEVYRICDEVVVLNSGKMEVFGEKTEVFLNPKTIANSILVGFDNYSRHERISGKPYASDFGIYLDENIDEKAKYIAFKSSDIDIDRALNDENALYIKRIIKEVKGSTLILNKKSSTDDYKDIKVDISNEKNMLKKGDQVSIRIQNEKIAQIKA